jgi:hypothetical protein
MKNYWGVFFSHVIKGTSIGHINTAVPKPVNLLSTYYLTEASHPQLLKEPGDHCFVQYPFQPILGLGFTQSPMYAKAGINHFLSAHSHLPARTASADGSLNFSEYGKTWSRCFVALSRISFTTSLRV